MPTNLTNEEKELELSARESHSLIELCNCNGWKLIKEKFFDVTIKECGDYLEDVKNTDMVMIQAKRLQKIWIQTLLNEITTHVTIGLEDEIELVKRKEKKRKK